MVSQGFLSFLSTYVYWFHMYSFHLFLQMCPGFTCIPLLFYFIYPSSFVSRKPEGYHQRSLNQITSFNHHARSNLSAHHSSGHHQFLQCRSSTRFSITFCNRYISESELFLPSFDSDIFLLFFSFFSSLVCLQIDPISYGI